MQLKSYQNRLSELSARFNLMVFFVVSLLLANIILACLAWYGIRHHAVEITPFFSESRYFKSEHTVDSQYLSLMAENFIYSRLNVTPETVSANHQRLLRFVDTRHYATLLKQLNAETIQIKKQKMASEFIITALAANPKALTARISGILKRSVGLQALKDEHLTYQLTFQYSQGHLTLLTFNQEKQHA